MCDTSSECSIQGLLKTIKLLVYGVFLERNAGQFNFV